MGYPMNKNRIDAFSDGVIAIIITIMALELRLPELKDNFSDHDMPPSTLLHPIKRSKNESTLIGSAFTFQTVLNYTFIL